HGSVCLSSPSTSLDPALDEDCLFLDVYAPTNCSAPLPVFVWFPGGGFNSLSGPDTSASPLIAAGDFGFVVVTINYRVGPWGFLASREVQQNGDLNAGLLDQRQALHWVQEHIHHFGGDRNHVTIGGASAGAASVDLHLSAYGGREDGLFHAAAAESQSFGAQLTVAESQYQYDALVTRVGCANAPDTLHCLRSTDMRTLASNNPNIPTPGSAGGVPVFMWSNVIDGTFTPDYTYALFAAGKFVRVPVIFGDDTNEGTIFTPKNISSYPSMNSFLLNNFVRLTPAQLATIDALATYDRARVPSWNYHWDYLTAAGNQSGLGVQHTAEFGSIWGEADHPLSAVIAGYWASFIRSKDPNTFKLDSAPTWDTFGGAMRRVHFPGGGSPVAMESVPDDQRERYNDVHLFCTDRENLGISPLASLSNQPDPQCLILMIPAHTHKDDPNPIQTITTITKPPARNPRQQHQRVHTIVLVHRAANQVRLKSKILTALQPRASAFTPFDKPAPAQ
ncbi:Lipase, partial [Lachnellula willkommii]